MALYPQTEQGGDRKSKDAKNQTADSAVVSPPSFVKDTAAKTKQSERVVYEEVQIANRISEPVRNAIHADCGKIIAHLI